MFGKRGKGLYQDEILKQIENHVDHRSELLKRKIRERISNEQFVSGVLTFASIMCVVILWFKMNKVLSSKQIHSFG